MDPPAAKRYPRFGARPAMIRQLSVEELKGELGAEPNSILLLDVREADEREFARIEPSLHIPMNRVPGRLGELPKEREIVVYCHTGMRSQVVAAYLERSGFPKVANLRGGIDEWSIRVDPQVPRYG